MNYDDESEDDGSGDDVVEGGAVDDVVPVNDGDDVVDGAVNGADDLDGVESGVDDEHVEMKRLKMKMNLKVMKRMMRLKMKMRHLSFVKYFVKVLLTVKMNLNLVDFPS